MDNDRDFDKFDYDEMSKLFEEAKRERFEREEEEKYKEIRRTSKRDQANAFLESLSVGRPVEPVIEPPMESITMKEIEQIPRSTSFEPYDSTKADSLLNSLKSKKQEEHEEYEYVEVEEQSLKETKIVDTEKVKATVKKALAILITIGVLTAGAITYGSALHERDKNMMDGMDKYTEFLEETGQKPSEENYQYFVEHVYNQDEPVQSSGGRTN